MAKGDAADRFDLADRTVETGQESVQVHSENNGNDRCSALRRRRTSRQAVRTDPVGISPFGRLDDLSVLDTVERICRRRASSSGRDIRYGIEGQRVCK